MGTRWTLPFSDAFSRKFRAGDSEAYVGATDVVVISKPFTPGEDAVVSWLLGQDSTYLEEAYALPDGRDLFLMRREHRLQTLASAIREHNFFVSRSLHATFKD
jgi:hypothetical protein